MGKRLVVLSGSYPGIECGISPYVQRLSELIVKHSDYKLYIITSKDQKVDTSIASGYSVLPIIEKWSVTRATDIAREVLKLHPDIVHIQNPTIKYAGIKSIITSLVAKKLKRAKKPPGVYLMQHDIAISHPFIRRRYKGLFKTVDGIIVSNNRDYKAITRMGIDQAKVHKAPFSSYINLHESNQSQKRHSRETIGISQECSCIAYFGFVLPQRNVDKLIKAIAILNNNGKNVYGIIVGGSHKESPEYLDYCKQVALNESVNKKMIFTGYADEATIADALAAADVFVSLPERGADMRNTSIITGLLAQLPVITSENPRYYIDDDLKGFGCVNAKANEPADIAQKIEQVLKKPPGREERIDNARRLSPETVWVEHIKATLKMFTC